MIKGLLLIIAIIIFAIMTILAFIFAIIYFVNNKKGRFAWVGGFVGSLAGLIICVFLLVNGIVNKVSSIGNKIEESFKNSNRNLIEQMDTTGSRAYLVPDSINNVQIERLKTLQPENKKGSVSPQFYHYLGFKEYYRLPLRYPFSLHCTDSLANASLFNEVDVLAFDESNNGDKDCEVNNISNFAFDGELLLAKRALPYDGKKPYLIYYFEKGKIEEFETLNKLILRANSLKFSAPFKFYGCKEYFDSFH